MKIITFKVGDTGCLGSDIKIRILTIQGKQVQLGFEAPRDIPIYRAELVLAPKKRQRQNDKLKSATSE
ncbi:carbon storage regulator [Pseudomonas fildesensis]|uniref:carbon storage regulator n=1 Tax=Pseudomonas fildesensis TaxID=1674920 RepID=UPI00137922FF|nr:carbon storage regulator [Pseudomonas fildesensis]